MSLALTMAPVTAYAQEAPPLQLWRASELASSPSEMKRESWRERVTPPMLLSLPTALQTETMGTLHRPTMTDIRLSKGAKTAIIVTAIVVGVLIIVGIVAVGRPHRL